MNTLIRFMGIIVAWMVFRATPDPASSWFIAVFAVIGWLRLFDLCWEVKKDDKEGP